MAVGLYARISEDPSDTRLGVERQVSDARDIARVRGWDVAGEYIDNDVSAFGRHVTRPQWLRLMDDLESGTIDGIVAYDLDRFAREPVDLERAIAAYDGHPALTFATVQGDIDLSSGDGLTMARVMVAFANKSSRDTSRRLKRKHLEIATSGRHIASRRPFGWKAGGIELDAAEASLVRQAVHDLMAGTSLRHISNTWNASDVRTSMGNEWDSRTVRQYLLQPRLSGLRRHQGRALVGADGAAVRGQWEPLLPVDEHEALVALLTSRQKSLPGGQDGQYRGGRQATLLLTGLLRCGLPECGRRMWSGGAGRYICSACRRVSIGRSGADGAVTDVVLAAHPQLSADVSDSAPWPGSAELEGVQARVSELMSAFTSGALSGAVVFPTVEVLEAKISELTAERAAYNRDLMVSRARPANLAEDWEDLTLDVQREVLSSLLIAVVVAPAGQHGSRPPARERLTFVWREEAQ